MGQEKKRRNIKVCKYWMKHGVMHNMPLGLTDEVRVREKWGINGEQDQEGIIAHSVACQGLFKIPTSCAVTRLPVFG